jgi:hypothetical protein
MGASDVVMCPTEFKNGKRKLRLLFSAKPKQRAVEEMKLRLISIILNP